MNTEQENMRVLVADDDTIMRAFLTEVLTDEGFDVTSVSNGSSACDALLATVSPKLAILDWNMPDVSGIDVIKIVREKKKHGETYIIVITGIADDQRVVTALDSGADDFLTKPCRKTELIARVRAGSRILNLNADRRNITKQLQHGQKLESIGQLAAGIAHEINTPVQYIGDNTRFIKDALDDILHVVKAAQSLGEVVRRGKVDADAVEVFNAALEDADIAFLSEQIPLAVSQSLEGLNRVSDIVRAMKEFAHPDSAELVLEDVNQLINTVGIVTRNEWKYVSELSLELDENIPTIPCLPGDLIQVFINLVVNAAHSIEDKRKKTDSTQKGHIRIQTGSSLHGESLEVRISDNGCGMPSSIRNRVFDPFFTTKEVGRGTGQGLTIAYSVIVDKHLGEIFFDTEEGEGTTFTIRLPLRRSVPGSRASSLDA